MPIRRFINSILPKNSKQQVFSYIDRAPKHLEVLSKFRDNLLQNILHSIKSFHDAHPKETIYGYAISLGQCGNALGYQIITEERMLEISEDYYNSGYRHKYQKYDSATQVREISKWLRWANTEDDWYMFGFEDSPPIYRMFEELVYRRKAFGENAEHLEEFCCDDVLATIHKHFKWKNNSKFRGIALSVQSDDSDFFTCLARCNPFRMTYKLWHENFLCREYNGLFEKSKSKDD